MKKGSKVRIIGTEKGPLVVPIVSLADLQGVDEGRKHLVYKMIKELNAERRQEAIRD